MCDNLKTEIAQTLKTSPYKEADLADDHGRLHHKHGARKLRSETEGNVFKYDSVDGPTIQTSIQTQFASSHSRQ